MSVNSGLKATLPIFHKMICKSKIIFANQFLRINVNFSMNEYVSKIDSLIDTHAPFKKT